MEDHKAVGVAALFGKGHGAAARQGGEAALDALDVAAVELAAGVGEGVRGVDGALILVQIGGGHGVGRRAGHLHEGGVFVAFRRDPGHVLGGGNVAVVEQAVGAGEVGAGAAQLRRAGVHLPDEVQHAAAHIVGDDAGGVVGAGHQQGIQQVDAAHRLTDAQARGHAVGVLDVLELLGHGGGHGHFAVQVLAALQQQQGGHHLGQAGHILLLVGVLGQDGLAGVGVEQIHRLGLAGRLDGHGVGGQPRQRRRGGKRQGEHQCCGTAEEPVLKHERTPLIDVPAQSAGNDFVLP